MASERHNEKIMRKPEDDESRQVQEDFMSNNPERGTKPKKGLELSSEQYDSVPVGTVNEGVQSKTEDIPSDSPQFQGGQTDSVKPKKEKNDMLLKEDDKEDMNGITAQDCDPLKRITTEEAKTPYTATKNTPLRIDRQGENTSTLPAKNDSSRNALGQEQGSGSKGCPCCSIL